MLLFKKSNLKPESKLRNKIAYAVGEIFLIVIGILIAVSINNWNEQRNRNNELNNILKIVKRDLIADIVEIKKVKNYYLTKQPYIEGVLQGTIDRAYYENNTNTFVILGYPELFLHKRGYGLLQNYIDAGGLSNNLVVNRIAAFYSSSIQDIEADDELRRNDQRENLTSWKNEQSWWSEYLYSKKADGFIKYALTDKDYVNRVASYHLVHYQAFLPELIKYQKKAQTLIQELERDTIESEN